MNAQTPYIELYSTDEAFVFHNCYQAEDELDGFVLKIGRLWRRQCLYEMRNADGHNNRGWSSR